MASPYPKPTALKLVEGNPGKRALPAHEPKPDGLFRKDAVRLCPKNLEGSARHWWRHYFRLLAGLRVLTEADLTALEKLASATAERVRYEETLSKSGPLLRHVKQVKVGADKEGAPIFRESVWPMVNPLWNVISTIREFELKLLREFGMTPSARTKVTTVGASASDSIEEMLA